MSYLPPDPPQPERATPWDRRVVGAMNVADSAKTGVVVLRVTAALVVAASLIGNYLYIFGRDLNDGASLDGSSLRFNVGQFLGSVATPLAFAGIVFGMSFLLAVYAARLDLDIVLADEQETSESDET